MTIFLATNTAIIVSKKGKQRKKNKSPLSNSGFEANVQYTNVTQKIIHDTRLNIENIIGLSISIYLLK